MPLGIMENKMETAIVYSGLYRGFIGIMENKMETTVSIVYWDSKRGAGSEQTLQE